MAATSNKNIDLSQAMNITPPDTLDWLVIAPVIWCIVYGSALLMLRKRTDLQHIFAIPGLFVLIVITGGLLAHVISSGPITMVMGRWLPPFGIAFTVDILGAFFAFTSAVVAFTCGLYGIGDVNASGRRYGFYPFLFMLMAGVSGAFLTGDIFNLYVWFEVLLISSFGLLILGSESKQLDGATKYAFLNLVATTLFLIATGYLYGIFGTLNMADIASKASEMGGEAPLYTLAFLYFVAFAMKAAAFPLNFWLPASYHTPRMVTSAIFAGLLTKVGVYALVRVIIMLFPFEHDSMRLFMAIIAALTMILAVFGALAQTDLRRMLGYLVISGIGVMLMGIAMGGHDGIAGTIVYAVHSMIVMTALYLAAGIAMRLGSGAGLTDLSGVYKASPFVAAICLMLFFAVSGLPPFSGFWPKYILVKASIGVGNWWVAVAILLTGFLTTIAVGRFWALCFWRADEQQQQKQAEHIPAADYIALIILTIFVVIIGLYPQPVVELAYEAAEQLSDPSDYFYSVFPQGASE